MNRLRLRAEWFKPSSIVLILLYGILATIPLVYGAVHPLMRGIYIFVILVVLGGWLLFCRQTDSPRISFWSVIPLGLVLYMVLQAVPIPLWLLDVLSPSRAQSIQTVNTLAETDIAFASLNYDGIYGIQRALFYLAGYLYYVVLTKKMTEDRNVLLIVCYIMVGVGALEAFYGLMQFINPHVGILWLKLKGRAAHGTIIYRNQYSSLINMIWPIAVALGVYHFFGTKRTRRDRSRRGERSSKKLFSNTSRLRGVLLIFLSVMMILSLIFSLSKGGFLSMLLIVGLLVTLYPYSLSKKILALSGLLLLVAGYGTMLGFETIIQRFMVISSASTTRFTIYLSSLPMLVDHWLTGVGAGSYQLLSPIYLKGFTAGILCDRVHCEYLETLIEFGLPVGGLFLGWLIAGICMIAVKMGVIWKKAEKGDLLTMIKISAFCGLVGFLAHGLVDFGWRLPANFLYAVTLLSVITACTKLQAKDANEREWLPEKEMLSGTLKN